MFLLIFIGLSILIYPIILELLTILCKISTENLRVCKHLTSEVKGEFHATNFLNAS